MLNLVIISINDINLYDIPNNDKLGKMVRNIIWQITGNTLMLMIVEEYVINEKLQIFDLFTWEGLFLT